MDRQRRRDLAVFHQQRQLRLERSISWRRTEKYDSERKIQSARGKKARFLALLKGNILDPRDVGLWRFAHPEDPKRIGRLKKMSWDYCPRGGCCMCGNPRRHGHFGRRETITIQERKIEDSFCDQLEMVFSEDR